MIKKILVVVVIIINSLFQPGDFSTGPTTELSCPKYFKIE